MQVDRGRVAARTAHILHQVLRHAWGNEDAGAMESKSSLARRTTDAVLAVKTSSEARRLLYLLFAFQEHEEGSAPLSVNNLTKEYFLSEEEEAFLTA